MQYGIEKRHFEPKDSTEEGESREQLVLFQGISVTGSGPICYFSLLQILCPSAPFGFRGLPSVPTGITPLIQGANDQYSSGIFWISWRNTHTCITH